MFDIYAHHFAEQKRIHRAVQRKQMGIEDQQDIPYPGAVSDSNNPKTTINVGTGWVRGAVLGALLTATGAGSVVGLTKCWTVPPTPTVTPVVVREPKEKPATTEPAPNGVPKSQEYDVIYEERQADGSWKEVKRERLSPK